MRRWARAPLRAFDDEVHRATEVVGEDRGGRAPRWIKRRANEALHAELDVHRAVVDAACIARYRQLRVWMEIGQTCVTYTGQSDTTSCVGCRGTEKVSQPESSGKETTNRPPCGDA